MLLPMHLDPLLEAKLRHLTQVFLAENEKLNLSALRTEEKCWMGNVLDSVAASELISNLKSPISTLLDLGTGGGFPLLPLALAMPQIQCTGLDSVKKKIDAVNRIIETMNIPNAHAISGRAEEVARDASHREHYDIVTSRAVAPLNMLLEYSSPFVKVGGHIVLWKSLQIEEELQQSAQAQKLLHVPLVQTHQYTLPGDWGTRQLLVFQKQSSLEKMYPRAIGEAKRKPL